MLNGVIVVAAVMLGVAMLLNLWRLLAGPGMADRVLALDTLAMNAIGLIVLLGIATRSPLYFEAALLIAALGFVGTVAFMRVLVRGRLVD